MVCVSKHKTWIILLSSEKGTTFLVSFVGDKEKEKGRGPHHIALDWPRTQRDPSASVS